MLPVHNPVISWHHGELTHWSEFCLVHCMHSTIVQPCFTTSVESPDTKQTTKIPACYNDLTETLSKTKATQLAIDLLSIAMPPKSKVYPLSRSGGVYRRDHKLCVYPHFPSCCRVFLCREEIRRLMPIYRLQEIE